jgi:hypothetical protein
VAPFAVHDLKAAQGATGKAADRYGTIQKTSREFPEFPRISEEKNRSD